MTFQVPHPTNTTPFRQVGWEQRLQSPADLAAWLLVKGYKDFKHRFLVEFPASKKCVPADLEPGHPRFMADDRYILDAAMKDAYSGWPLIFFAIKASRVKVVRFCLENGTDPDIKSPTGIPLLAYVLMSDENQVPLEMVRVVLEGGADPTVIPMHLDEDDDEIPEWIEERKALGILEKVEMKLTPDIK